MAYPEIALEEVEQNMTQQGLLLAKKDDSTLQIQGNQFDVKAKIHNSTTELLARTT